MDLLRDTALANIIAGISTAIAVIAIFVSIRIARQKKSLSYRILSSYPLLEVGSEIKDRLKIRFDGKLVEDIHMMVLKIVNDGEIPITADDFENPLAIELGDKARIISAEILEAKPLDMILNLSVLPHTVTVDPLLLNQDDQFSIKVLCTGSTGDNMKLSYRIQGIKQIRYQKENKPVFERPAFALVAGFISILAEFSVVALVLAMRRDPSLFVTLSPFIATLLIIILLNLALSISGWILVFASIFRRKS